MLSDFTKAWQLYLGFFFILIVMFAPGGIAGICASYYRMFKFGKLRQIWPSFWKILSAGLLIAAGSILVVEMLYQRSLGGVQDPVVKIAGVALNAFESTSWCIAALLYLIGGLGFLYTHARFLSVWNTALVEIEVAIFKGDE